MEVIVAVLIVILGAICSTRKYVNLNVLIDGILMLIINFTVISLTIVIVTYFPTIIDNIMISSFVIVLSFVMLGIIFLVSKEIMLGAIRILEYYMFKNKALGKGQVEVGTIVDIKKEYNTRRSERYYLIVDFNGKKIKSLYFIDNIYTIGTSIDVVTYKKHSFVILENI